jgi:hypothetical protein
MLPQLGTLGGTLSPRKPEAGLVKDHGRHLKGGQGDQRADQVGMMWSKMIRPVPAPALMADST